MRVSREEWESVAGAPLQRWWKGFEGRKDRRRFAVSLPASLTRVA